MRAPPQLTLPGLVVLILAAAILMYFEQKDEGAPQPRQEHTQATATRPDGEAGGFDYYSLVLSWSPTHCESPEGRDDKAQCAPRNGRPYAFILHGLWPQHERGYPESCPAETTWVPQPIIDRMLDVMPSKGLIIHEYRKHGTCSGLSPDGYYRTARKLYDRVTIPDRFRNPAASQYLGPGEVIDAFVAANPALRPDMLAVGCGGRDNRLREVRICFSKSGEPQSCGPNEAQRKLCRSDRMLVPPVK